LEQLIPQDLPFGVYWCSQTPPQGLLFPWLEKHNAVWVEHSDFDELMLLVRDAFELPHPRPGRFQKVFASYTDAYDKLSRRIDNAQGTDAAVAALKEAAIRSTASFPDWWSVELEARRVKATAPGVADQIYRAGVERFPASAELLGNYAAFLADSNGDI